MQLSDDAKKKLTGAMNEMSNSMLRAEAERELQKEVINNLFDEVAAEQHAPWAHVMTWTLDF